MSVETQESLNNTAGNESNLVWFGLVWFICSSIQSHMQHWTGQLQIKFTTQLIIYEHPHNKI
jgi:hypothetical protein